MQIFCATGIHSNDIYCFGKKWKKLNGNLASQKLQFNAVTRLNLLGCEKAAQKDLNFKYEGLTSDN